MIELHISAAWADCEVGDRPLRIRVSVQTTDTMSEFRDERSEFARPYCGWRRNLLGSVTRHATQKDILLDLLATQKLVVGWSIAACEDELCTKEL